MSKLAYRVERAFGYKVKVEGGNVTSLDWGNLQTGISISFGTPDHSEYYATEHQGAKGLRVVRFEITDAFWLALCALKKMGTSSEQERGVQWVKTKGANKFKVPSGSDGAHLSSRTKKTALTFADEWMPLLLQNIVKGTAAVEYLNEDETFPAKLGNEFFGWMTLSQIKEADLEVAGDMWDQDD